MRGPLVDTSVLADFYSGRVSPEADVLETLLAEGPDPAVAPVVIQEFLQGVSSDTDLTAARDYLGRFVQLSAPDYALHERAAQLHRSLRRRGVTPGTIDALIVAIAEAAGVPLLTSDAMQIRLCRQAGVIAL